MWPAFCGRINDARGIAGKPLPGMLNASLYSLCKTASFHDITTRRDAATTPPPGSDLVTSIGTSNLAELLPAPP